MNIKITPEYKIQEGKIIHINFGFKLPDGTQVEVKNGNVINEQNEINKSYINKSNYIMSFENKIVTQQMRKFEKIPVGYNSIIVITNNKSRKEEKIILAYKSDFPKIHKYEVQSNMLFNGNFSYVTFNISMLDGYIEKAEKLLERLKNTQKQKLPDLIQEKMQRYFKNKIISEEFINKLGEYFYFKTDLLKEDKIIDFIIENKQTDVLGESSQKIISNALAVAYLKSKGFNVGYRETNEIEKQAKEIAEKFDFKTHDLSKLDEYINVLKKDTFLTEEEYKKFAEIDNAFENVLLLKNVPFKYEELLKDDFAYKMTGIVAKKPFVKFDVKELKDKETIEAIKNNPVLKRITKEEKEEFEKLMEDKRTHKALEDLKIIKIGNEHYLCNFFDGEEFNQNVKFFDSYSKEKYESKFIIERMSIEKELLETVKEKENFIRKNIKDMLYTHSPLSTVSLNSEVLPNLVNYKTKKASIKDVLNNPILADLLRKTDYFPAIEYVLKRNEYKYPDKKTITFDLETMKPDIEEKIEEISPKNLGMREFAYLPDVLDVSTEKAKENFIKAFVEFKENYNKDEIEELKNFMEITDFIAIPVDKQINENAMTIESIPRIVGYNKQGEKTFTLNVNLFEFKDFFNEKLMDIKKFVKKPDFPNKIKYEIITALFNKISSFYKRFLGNDLLKAHELAKNFLTTINGMVEVKKIDGTNRDKFAELEILMAMKLADFDVLTSNLNEAIKTIEELNIKPIEKRKFIAFFENIETLYEKREEIFDVLVEVQKKYPDKREEIKEAVEAIIKEIDNIETLAQKEAKSFIYTTKILLNLKQIKKSEDKETMVNVLKSAERGFRIWATNAVGLMEEQFEDALNATILHLKNDYKTINYFHDMGTGKTRTVLFTSLLYGALRPNAVFAFAIQNKNALDIYDQLKEMLPSLTIFVNKNFKNKNFVNNTEIPFSVINSIYPNFISPAVAKIFKTSENYTKQQVIKNFVNKMYETEKLLKNKSLKELREIAPIFKYFRFEEVFDKAYKETVSEELAKLDNKLKSEQFKNIKKEIFKNYLAGLLTVLEFAQSDNVFEEKIYDILVPKIKKDLKTIFNSYIDYLKNQKNNNIVLLSKNAISALPLKEEETTELKTKGWKIKTKYDIDEFILANYTPDKINPISEIALLNYRNIDYTKMEKENVFLAFSVFQDDILKKIIERIIQQDYNMEVDIGKFKVNIDELIVADYKNLKIEDSISQVQAISKETFLKMALKNEILSQYINEKNVETFIQKINAYYLSLTYTYRMASKDKKYKEQGMIFYGGIHTDFALSQTKMDFDIPLRENKGFLIEFNTKDNVAKVIRATVKNKKEEIKPGDKKISRTLKEIQANGVKVTFKNGKVDINFSFDVPIKYKISTNLNSSFLLELIKNKEISISIDEAHKNVKDKQKLIDFMKHENPKGIIVQATGTPITGTAGSIAKNTSPFDEKERLKEKEKLFKLLGGVNKIKSELFKFIYLIKNPSLRFQTLKEIIKLMNYDYVNFIINLESLIRTLSIKYPKGYFSSISTDLIYNELNKEIKQGIKFYNQLEEELKNYLSLDKEITDKHLDWLLLNNKTLEDMSGITNPKIVNLLDTKSGLFSIKTSEDRKYNLIGGEYLKDGKAPKTIDYERIKQYDFFDVAMLLKMSKKQIFITITEQIAKYLTAVTDLIAKDEELMDMVEKFLKSNGITFSRKEFLKAITPETASGKDTIGEYFKDFFFFKAEIPEKKLKVIKGVLIFSYKYKQIIKSHFEEMLNSLELNIFNKNVKFNFKKQQILYKNKPVELHVNINLNKYFKNVLKEEAYFDFNYLHKQNEEIIETMFSEASFITSDNLLNKKSTLLYTNRTASIGFNLLTVLEELIKNKTDNEPIYILVNMPNDKNLNEIVNKLDYELLKSKKIFVQKTDTNRIYNDYNYGIPRNATTLIISNYKALAEGFRFPTIYELIFSGKPSDVATVLQASARTFKPGVRNEAHIRLATYVYVSEFVKSIQIRKKTNQILTISERTELIKESIDNYVKSPIKTFMQSLEETVRKKDYKIEKKDKKAGAEKNQIGKRIKNLYESYVTSLRFIGAKVEGGDIYKTDGKLIKAKFKDNKVVTDEIVRKRKMKSK